MEEKRIRLDGKVHKRSLIKKPKSKNDIYVSSKTRIEAVVKHICQLMIYENQRHMTVHGLGASMMRAITIAQRVQEKVHGHVDLRPTTDTITLIDDVVPEDMDEEIATQKRNNSALHIQIVAGKGLAQMQKQIYPQKQKPQRNKAAKS